MKNLYQIIIALTALTATCAPAAGQDVVTVEGEYTLQGDSRLSPAESKRIALENARIAALSREFGTIVSQELQAAESDREDSNRFLALTSSEVKGEWLGDLGEPEFDVSLDSQGSLVVRCRIKGRARRLSNKAPDFEAVVMRNGTDYKQFADTRFADGNQMYLYFSAPLDGYINVYLADESGNVYCMLPYPRSDVSEIKTRRGYDYVFFDETRPAPEYGSVDGILLTASDHIEYNKLYVIFSPEPFSPAPAKYDSDTGLPTLGYEKFQEWLIRSRRNDPRMGVKSMNLTISPR